MRGFLVGGPASGAGKTTVCLALIAALRRRGCTVQPFKGGPDFLDTGHHTRMAGRPARNVDTWMLSPQANLNLVQEAAWDADAILVEGMMGLFDGKSGESDAGSSAEIAKLLKLPVILVLDASKSARSLAAVVLGFESFDPDLKLTGVILNRVASERHYTLLRSAITLRCKTPVFGWLPRDAELSIPERHLGLHTAQLTSDEELEHLRGLFADRAEKYFDLEAIAALNCGLEFRRPEPALIQAHAPIRIGVARDEAFCFYYEDNLDLLRGCGASILAFSPLHDRELPDDLDALYLGGGYPELHAARLAGNAGMLAAIRDFAACGKPVYAECGGMMYLAKELTDLEGAVREMAGVLPLAMQMTDKLVQFGYVTVQLTARCLLGPAGLTLRGHSFHYSRLLHSGGLSTAYYVQYSLSGREEAEGFATSNILASYIHLHFRAAPSVAEHFVEAARHARSARLVSA